MIYIYITSLAATLFGYAVPILNVVAPFFFYKRFIQRPGILGHNPFFYSALIFATWLLVITLYWHNFLGFLAGAYAIIPTVLLFFYATETLNKEKAYQYLNLLVSLSLLPAALAIYQEFLANTSILERSYATFGNANFYASYLLMVIPVAFALAMQTTSKNQRLFYAFTTLINLYCLALTNSRSSIVALFLGFLFFALAAKNYRLLVFTALTASLLALSVFINPNLIPRYGIISGELQERFAIWSLGWYAVGQHPIVGTGLTSFYTKYIMNYPGKYAPHAHNLYLNIWVEGGIIALMLLFWNLKVLYTIAFKKIARNKNLLVVGILSGLTAALIQSFMDNPLENFQTGTLFMYFVAVLLKL